jgi:hypothetical protein
MYTPLAVVSPIGAKFDVLWKAKARHGICVQDTLKSTTRGCQNKQNCLWQVGLPLTLVKKKHFSKMLVLSGVFNTGNFGCYKLCEPRLYACQLHT